MAISSARSAEQRGYIYMVVIGIERVVMVEMESAWSAT